MYLNVQVDVDWIKLGNFDGGKFSRFTVNPRTGHR